MRRQGKSTTECCPSSSGERRTKSLAAVWEAHRTATPPAAMLGADRLRWREPGKVGRQAGRQRQQHDPRAEGERAWLPAFAVLAGQRQAHARHTCSSSPAAGLPPQTRATQAPVEGSLPPACSPRDGEGQEGVGHQRQQRVSQQAGAAVQVQRLGLGVLRPRDAVEHKPAARGWGWGSATRMRGMCGLS